MGGAQRSGIAPRSQISGGEESWRSPLAKKYPLQFISTHFRKRALSQFDNVPWMKELGGQELQISRQDALSRGIRSGDTVRVFNDRVSS